MLSFFTNRRKNNEGAGAIIGYYGYGVILTYLSVVSAVLGMFFALGGNIRFALISLMVSGLCDMLDGSVAKLKKRTDREKSYCIQIDALADLISFGAFPVVIGYAIYNQTENGMIFNIIVFSAYLLAALIRLAYFNVIETELESRNEKRVYYEGLPTTNAALIIPAVYSVCKLFDISLPAVYNTLLVILTVAFVLKVRIPRPKGIFLFFYAFAGVSILSSLLLFG